MVKRYVILSIIVFMYNGRSWEVEHFLVSYATMINSAQQIIESNKEHSFDAHRGDFDSAPQQYRIFRMLRQSLPFVPAHSLVWHINLLPDFHSKLIINRALIANELLLIFHASRCCWSLFAFFSVFVTFFFGKSRIYLSFIFVQQTHTETTRRNEKWSDKTRWESSARAADNKSLTDVMTSPQWVIV